MNVLACVILLIAGWFIGDALMDQVVEKCSKGYTFTVKKHEFRCVRSDLRGAVDAVKGSLEIKNPEDE